VPSSSHLMGRASSTRTYCSCIRSLVFAFYSFRCHRPDTLLPLYIRSLPLHYLSGLFMSSRCIRRFNEGMFVVVIIISSRSSNLGRVLLIYTAIIIIIIIITNSLVETWNTSRSLEQVDNYYYYYYYYYMFSYHNFFPMILLNQW
jgi:hypothetical protein